VRPVARPGDGRAAAAEGADIIALDVCEDLPTTSYSGATPEDLAETVALVEKLDRRVIAVQADVRDYDKVESSLKSAVAELGRLDVVLANAGMTSGSRVWEIDADHWKATIDINLTGAFHTAKAAIPILIEQGTGGSIVFTSSVAGLVGLPWLGDYAAAKHGVTGLSKTMANELAQYWIRVNTVHPFGVATGLQMNEIGTFSAEAPLLAPMFMGSLPDYVSQSEDIAAAVAWLASDEARHVTGIQLPVDLGRTNR
jgi:SDR family mycofactocin-dependent oxidoreductase